MISIPTEKRSIGRAVALAIARTGWWKNETNRTIALFQLRTEELCLPFDRFHEAVEKTVGYPVYTHDFGIEQRLAQIEKDILDNENT